MATVQCSANYRSSNLWLLTCMRLGSFQAIFKPGQSIRRFQWVSFLKVAGVMLVQYDATLYKVIATGCRLDGASPLLC